MLTAAAIVLSLGSPSAAHSSAAAADTIRSTVLIAARPAGSQLSWAEPDGTLRYTLSSTTAGGDLESASGSCWTAMACRY